MSANALQQKVIELCRHYGCNLNQYGGSHFMVEANDYGDKRVWTTNSHSLTVYIDNNPTNALREILALMAGGFSDEHNGCDDGDDCEICHD